MVILNIDGILVETNEIATVLLKTWEPPVVKVVFSDGHDHIFKDKWFSSKMADRSIFDIMLPKLADDVDWRKITGRG